ncbi:hypothetical protein [Staphylococcus aureus]|nr:hypothetical protein [Staphylococcus aureus]
MAFLLLHNYTDFIMNRVHNNIYNFNHNEKGRKKTKIYTQHRKYFKKM